MRHYEIVLIIHPDQSEQANQMIEKYIGQVKQSGGHLHRLEDWGRRHLAYPIQKVHKGHYLLVNIECDPSTLKELELAFKFNDAIIRSLILSKKSAITTESPMLKNSDDKEDYSLKDSEPHDVRDGDAMESETDGDTVDVSVES